MVHIHIEVVRSIILSLEIFISSLLPFIIILVAFLIDNSSLQEYREHIQFRKEQTPFDFSLLMENVGKSIIIIILIIMNL